jgi:hypothetical protein
MPPCSIRWWRAAIGYGRGGLLILLVFSKSYVEITQTVVLVTGILLLLPTDLNKKSTTSTNIHEDKGVQNENEILWYSLDGSTREICPIIVLSKRPMGCQYINPHNSPILNVFNFNTNIQIGDVSQVFFSTIYTSKLTQEKDSEKQLQIGCAIIKRMKRQLEESSSRKSSNDGCNQANLEPSFCERLCRDLSGLNAATTRNVISATMAHLIPLNEGLRFVLSHSFSELLVRQMEATLEGQDVNVRIRTSKLTNGEIKSWPDSLADDYINCPQHQDFEHMSFYEMTRCYKKVLKPLQIESKEGYKFSYTHPGHELSHFIKLRHKTVPRISLPTETVCPLKDLQLNTTKPTKELLEKREIYAKMAILMFYPFRPLADLRIEGSYWKKISQQLKKPS